MNSTQIRWVLDASSTLPAVSTVGIEVVEWRLPNGELNEVELVRGSYRRLPWQLAGGFNGPARPYGLAVDGMAIYKGVQL